MAPKKKKEIAVIDRGGAKTVKKKTAAVTWVKRIFLLISVVWIAALIWAPLHVKNTYSEPIKKSIVVSMFFDLQRSIVDQYEKLLDGIKKSINLEKPVSMAIDQVKLASGAVNKVSDTTAKAKEATAAAQQKTDNAKKLTGLASKLGVNTSGVDKAVARVDNSIAKADAAVAKVDDVTAQVNAQLDKIENGLTKTLQTQVDQMIDDAIKAQLDKNAGGLGSTLLTNYGIKHVYPWDPTTWGTATKIYNDLEKSNVGVVQIITGTVNKYFGYAAWGLVALVWLIGFVIWFMVFKKVKAFTRPFVVCPRCGHAFVDKRTAYGFLKVFQPWKWL
ncbi:hypothetical protein HDR63_01770 [bacterium]|nr:hypothetical protein [bacterium]